MEREDAATRADNLGWNRLDDDCSLKPAGTATGGLGASQLAALAPAASARSVSLELAVSRAYPAQKKIVMQRFCLVRTPQYAFQRRNCIHRPDADSRVALHPPRLTCTEPSTMQEKHSHRMVRLR